MRSRSSSSSAGNDTPESTTSWAGTILPTGVLPPADIAVRTTPRPSMGLSQPVHNPRPPAACHPSPLEAPSAGGIIDLTRYPRPAMPPIRSNLPTVAAPDVQARVPATRVSLSRVGVTGVEKILRISVKGSEQLYHAGIECYVDLNPQQTGGHMSRFEEVGNEA